MLVTLPANGKKWSHRRLHCEKLVKSSFVAHCLDKWSNLNGCIFNKSLGCESLEQPERNKHTTKKQEVNQLWRGDTTKDEWSISVTGWFQSGVNEKHNKLRESFGIRSSELTLSQCWKTCANCQSATSVRHLQTELWFCWALLVLGVHAKKDVLVEVGGVDEVDELVSNIVEN